VIAEARRLHGAARMLSPRRRSIPSFIPLIAILPLAALASACVLDDDVADDDPPLGSVSSDLITEKNYSIAAGLTHTCALQLADGTVQCWGRNNYGQLGNGTTVSSSAPVTVQGITGATAVTAGAYHSCAVLLDGTARCWGYGANGQLGNGSTASQLTPVTVTSLTAVTSISAGWYHTCASRTGGTVRCWGSNTNGQLGNSTTTSTTLPTAVGAPYNNIFYPLTGVVEVETGRYSTCARQTTGAVRCWGLNSNGQLGDGTLVQRTIPTAVSGMTTAVEMSVGDYHACAAVGVGRARCWGWNAFGQLGDGTTTQRTTPVEVKRLIAPGLSYPIVNVSAVAAGNQHTCLRSAGRVWCMGRNNQGQLGQPASAVSEPLAEQTPVMADEVSAGGYHTCARRPGGQVVCFGQDTYGQVGEAGTCPTNPTANLVSVTAPNGQLHLETDPSGRLYYTADDTIDLHLETTACATVSEVGFVYGPINDTGDDVEPGSSIGYEVTSTLDRPDGVREMTVRIRFDNPGTGMTFPVNVDLTSPAGNTATAAFTLSLVQAVNAHGGITSLSQPELFDEVLVAMFEKWGDTNYYERNGVNLYDLDYAGMSLFMDSAGISFHFRTKADIIPGPVDSDLCNPTVDASGRFQVVLDSEGEAATQWISGPDVDVDFPFGCDAATAGLITIGAAIANEVVDDRVAKKIDDKIKELNDNCGSLGCGFVINRISHIGSTLEIELNSLYDSVTYRQPYVSTQLDATSVGDPMRRGIAIPANEQVVIMAGGIAQVCKMQSGVCDAPQVGAAGLFNWNWDEVLIPNPWPDCDQEVCPYYSGRHQAWDRQIGFRRDLAAIPMPDVNPGAVITRVLTRSGDTVTAAPLTHAADMICRFDPTAGADAARVVVGRNDVYLGGPWNSEYGTGDALITIGFAGTLAAAVDLCAN
jgi:hypothetical protein